MAKKVEFASERMERRRNARWYWMSAAALVLMIAIAVAVALRPRSERGGTFTGEQTAYPYAWTEEKDGSVTLELDRSGEEGFVWTVVDADESVTILEADGATAREAGESTLEILTVQPAKKQPADKLRIVLTPKAAGRATFTMGLLNASDPSQCSYEMTVLTEVIQEGRQLNAFLLSAGGKAFQLAVSGEGADFAYGIDRNEYGNVVVTVTDKNYVEPVEEDDSEKRAAQSALVTDESGDGEEPSDELPEISYFGYTWDEYIALPAEERDALIEAYRAELKEQGLLDEPDLQPPPEEQQQTKGWQCVSDNEEVVQSLGVIYEGASSSAYLLPTKTAGEATVRLTHGGSGAEITLVCEVDEDGDFHIVSHSINP